MVFIVSLLFLSKGEDVETTTPTSTTSTTTETTTTTRRQTPGRNDVVTEAPAAAASSDDDGGGLSSTAIGSIALGGAILLGSVGLCLSNLYKGKDKSKGPNVMFIDGAGSLVSVGSAGSVGSIGSVISGNY